MNRPEAPLVFITGASSGIGAALAVHYASAGWRVALVARREGALRALARQHGWSHEQWRAWSADVAEPEAIMDVGQACLVQWGVPDVVIANAGISLGVDSAEREDIAHIARSYAVNNVGMAATFHPFIAPMRARGAGRLVGIASVAGVRGLPGHGAYCASKAGVIGYCESLRGELGGTGVKVVTLLPGYVDTPLTRANRYPMPFLMPADAFARRAARAIERGVSYRVIPWPMAIVARLLRLLPNAVLDRVLAGQPRKHRAATTPAPPP